MVFTDQLGRQIHLEKFPTRIVSLVPSQTELLYSLGLENEVVGITKFCIHPKSWYKSKSKVGGTKKLRFDVIKDLKPDLIIGNKEENDKDCIQELMKDYPVWMSDIFTLDNAIDMVEKIGEVTNKSIQAKEIVSGILDSFSALENISLKVKTAYFIWSNPLMVAGHDTFINEMMKLAGFENVFTHHDSRYPEVTVEDIVAQNPELILLSSEPFPFNDTHLNEFKAICPNATIKIVDGELFSWYGSRLLKTPEYLKELKLR